MKKVGINFICIIDEKISERAHGTNDARLGFQPLGFGRWTTGDESTVAARWAEWSDGSEGAHRRSGRGLARRH
jgi:hypothetical protein